MTQILQPTRRVLVTGSTGALGRGVVARFRKEGLEVVEWDQTQKKVPPTLEFDHWVHCAGAFRFLSIEKSTDEEIALLMDANFHSAFRVLRMIVPGMKQRRMGRIVFVGANAAFKTPSGMAAYGASKAALHQLVISAADELKGTGLTINAVCPSIIDTPANRKDMPDADFSKWVSVEDLADVILGLTLSNAGAVNGALIPVTGKL